MSMRNLRWVLGAAAALTTSACSLPGVAHHAAEDPAHAIIADRCPTATVCAQSLVDAWRSDDLATASIIAVPGVVDDLFNSVKDPSDDWEPAYLDPDGTCPPEKTGGQTMCIFRDGTSQLVLSVMVDDLSYYQAGSARSYGPISEVAFTWLPPGS